MKLVGKVPVEPLDDERLTNIERRLVVHVAEMSQRPVRAPRRLLAFATVAMAIAIAGLVGYKLRGDDTPVVATREPEHIAMRAGALDLGDAQIAGTDFAVERSDGRVVVTMQPGTLDLHVDHEPGRLFVVKAGDVEIEDVGTRFSVDWQGANLDVRVTEGEVKVKHAGKELSVTAGNAWTVELGPITIAQLDERHAATPASNDIATSPPVQATDAVAVAPVGSGSGNGNGSASGTTNGSGHGSGARPKPGTPSARKALEKAAYDPPTDVGTNDPRAAIAQYLQLVRNMDGEDKAQMLYSIAVMQHRGKQDKAALYTISGVLKRQGGPAYKAALWLNVRITCLSAFDDSCRIAAKKYLSKFEAGTQSGVAQEILKEISRGQ